MDTLYYLQLKNINCFKLVREYYKRELGINLPIYSEPNHDDNFCSVVHSIINNKKEMFIQLLTLEPHCIITFYIVPKYTSHIGVVLPNLKQFIHCLDKKGVMIDRISKWKNRVTGYYKWVQN